MVDLRKLKAKAGIEDAPVEGKDAVPESAQTARTPGKRRFWFEEDDRRPGASATDVGNNIGNTLGDTVGNNIGDTRIVGHNVGNNVGHNVGNNVGHNVGNNVGHNVGNNVGHNVGNNVGHNVGNKNRNRVAARESVAEAVRTLGPTRQKVLDYLFDLACQEGGTSTPIVKVQEACKRLGLKAENWKRSTQRLAWAGIIAKHGFKSGGSVFTITDEAYKTVSRQRALGTSSGTSSGTGSGTGSGTMSRTTMGTGSGTMTGTPEGLLSSRSFKTLETTTENLGPALHTEFDLGALVELGVSLSPAQITQLMRAGLNPEMLQDSLDAYAFDIRHNGKLSGIADPVAYFMGAVLRHGIYNRPHNYRSPAELAREAYLTAKRREQERLRRMDQEIIDVEFDEWWSSLPHTERQKYAPDAVGAEGMTPGSPFHLECVKDVFAREVWPSREAEQAVRRE